MPNRKFLVASLFLLTLPAHESLGQQSPLGIQIANVEKNKGKVVVEIYRDKSTWLEKPFRKTTLSTNEGSKIVSFDVPDGRYAISLYQDINGNGKLDMNFLGIPKEPVGFGNNYKPFGSPKFESSSIEHNSTSKPQAIKLYDAL